MKTDVHHEMNRADLDRILVALGGHIVILRKTGDIAYSHRLLSRRPRGNRRRKDAPRHLTQFVLDVIRALDTQAANDDTYKQ